LRSRLSFSKIIVRSILKNLDAFYRANKEGDDVGLSGLYIVKKACLNIDTILILLFIEKSLRFGVILLAIAIEKLRNRKKYFCRA
jgi:hypothetical protein